MVADLFGDWVRDLRYFWFRETELDGIPILLARSGWSKQDGFELYLRDSARGTDLWNRVKSAGAAFGIVPGAPSDVERVESGLLSYGADARGGANPFEVGLDHLVDLERKDDFVGKAALQKISDEGVRRRRVGLFLGGDRICGISQPYDLYLGKDVVGLMTEAVFSPRLDQNIGIAIIDSKIADDQQGLEVAIGEQRYSEKISMLPFC
jgi:aminomethyltransferase